MSAWAEKQITKEQAIVIFESGLWKDWTKRQRAEFQLRQKRLAMPFDVFHEAVEFALGRSVFTHEFGLNWEGLVAELDGTAGAPSLDEIMALIPAEKLVVVVAPSAEETR